MLFQNSVYLSRSGFLSLESSFSSSQPPAFHWPFKSQYRYPSLSPILWCSLAELTIFSSGFSQSFVHASILALLWLIFTSTSLWGQKWFLIVLNSSVNRAMAQNVRTINSNWRHAALQRDRNPCTRSEKLVFYILATPKITYVLPNLQSAGYLRQKATWKAEYETVGQLMVSWYVYPCSRNWTSSKL